MRIYNTHTHTCSLNPVSASDPESQVLSWRIRTNISWVALSGMPQNVVCA